MSPCASTHRFFAPCPRGLESALAAELAAIDADAIVATDGGVAFSGAQTTLYRANLESRIASRILLKVGEGGYRNEDDIYRCAHCLPWNEWFERKRTIRIAVAAVRAPLKSLDFATLRIKDAVCDAFRRATGARPDVDTRFPDVRIHAFLDARQATFYLDTSGEPLFKRGWRTDAVDAPLRENLAAGILSLAGWTPQATLLDPMCGGGTFVLEAATLALAIAPGANRGFGFERLTLYDPRLWRQVRHAAEARRKPTVPLAIYASDRDRKAIRATAEALQRAGLEGSVHVQQCDAEHRAVRRDQRQEDAEHAVQHRAACMHDALGELHDRGDDEDEGQRAQMIEAERCEQPVLHYPRERGRQRQHEAGRQRHAVGRVETSGYAHERAQAEELRQHEVVDEHGTEQGQGEFGHGVRPLIRHPGESRDPG